MKLTLNYLGADDFDQPVYKDRFGRLWKDIEPYQNTGPILCTTIGNELDGEPNICMHRLKKYADVEVVFEPQRVVWN